MQELLQYILEKLSEKPEKVNIQKEEDEFGITFSITADEEDKGRLIGKGGANIKAIRNILAILAKQKGQRVFLKIE